MVEKSLIFAVNARSLMIFGFEFYWADLEFGVRSLVPIVAERASNAGCRPMSSPLWRRQAILNLCPQATEMPPLALTTWPVMWEASGLARKTMIGAIFSGTGTPSRARFSAFWNSLRLNSPAMTLS